MVPIPVNGEITLIVAIWADLVEKYIGFLMPAISVILIVFSFLMAVYTKVARPSFTERAGFLKSLFDIGPIALTTRGLGALFGILTIFQIGPAFIWSEATGGNILIGLITTLVAIFF